MNDKIDILGLEIDNIIAKEAMKKVMDYIETEPVHVIEMITMGALGKFQGMEDATEMFKSFDLALASDKGILEAVGVTDERSLKEVQELLFVKMVMRYLHKNSVRTFLLANSQEDLHKLENYMQEDYANIQVIETATMEEHGASDDMLLNLINGAEATCVLSVLPSPMEEQFIYRNRALVNARMWLGLGNLLDEMKQKKSSWRRAKDFLLRQLWKKKIAKKGENA
mgnify:FL=1